MKAYKSYLLLLFCLIFSKEAFSQYTEVINSNRPGVSRSAFSVGTDVVQFEVGPYIIKEKRTPAASYEVEGFGVDFAVRYGFLLEELEAFVEGTYQNDTQTFFSSVNADFDRANMKSLVFGAKYLLFDPQRFEGEEKPNLYSYHDNYKFKWKSLVPAVAVSAGLHYDQKNNPFLAPGVEGISPRVMIATQNNFPGGFVFVTNFIKERLGTDYSDFHYILTLTHSFNPKWVVFAETQGIKSDFYADNLFRLGGAFLFSKDIQFDTAVTFNTKDTPSVFSVNFGASYRLDFHNERIR